MLSFYMPMLWSTTGDQIDAWGWRFGSWSIVLPLPWEGDGAIYRRLDSLKSAPSLGTGRNASEADLRGVFATERDQPGAA